MGDRPTYPTLRSEFAPLRRSWPTLNNNSDPRFFSGSAGAFENTHPAIIRERLSAGLGVARPDKRQRPNIRRNRNSFRRRTLVSNAVLHLVRHDGRRYGLSADYASFFEKSRSKPSWGRRKSGGLTCTLPCDTLTMTSPASIASNKRLVGRSKSEAN